MNSNLIIYLISLKLPNFYPPVIASRGKETFKNRIKRNAIHIFLVSFQLFYNFQLSFDSSLIMRFFLFLFTNQDSYKIITSRGYKNWVILDMLKTTGINRSCMNCN